MENNLKPGHRWVFQQYDDHKHTWKLIVGKNEAGYHLNFWNGLWKSPDLNTIKRSVQVNQYIFIELD